jgi:hypothetical protein
MADDSSNLNDMTGNLNDAKTAISNLLPSLKTIYDTFSNMIGKSNIDAVSNLGKEISNLGDSLIDANENVKMLGESINVVSKNDSFAQTADNVMESFGKLATVIGRTNFFDKFLQDSTTSINGVSENIDVLINKITNLKIPGVSGVIDVVGKLGSNFINNAEQAEKLEASYIALTSSGGDLNSLFDQSTGKLNDLTAMTTSYMNTVLSSAKATGLSTQQSSEFANTIKTIPDFLNQYVKTGENAGDMSNTLTTAMKLMTGTGQSQKDVLNELQFSYDNLSQGQGKIADGAQKAAEFIATMSSISKVLNLQLSDVRGVVEDVAKEFRFVGNETDATANIFKRYTEALRETGLTSKASTEIIGTMIKNMSELTVGTKAFLSLKGGGPGGLQGAFQIEELLGKGKLDEVVKMAEGALKQQFGGRIYTRAEAAESPEAASQFMRQRELLKSGAFGIGKNLSDNQATKLLEALGKGDIGSITKEIKSGQDAVNDAVSQGTQIQERNNNELKKAALSLSQIEIYEAIQAGATLKRIAGTGTPTSKTSEDIKRGMKDATTGIGKMQNDERITMERTGTKTGDQSKELILLARSTTKNFQDVGTALVGNAEDAILKLRKETKSPIAAPIERPAIKSPKIAAPIERPKDDMKASILKAATTETSTSLIDRTKTAITSATTERAKQTIHQAQQTQNHKIMLEITAPAGFGVKSTNQSKDVILQFNEQVANPTGNRG